jgi:hypothetical protein
MTVDAYVKWAKDMAERALSTYIQAALGLLIASPGLDIGKVEACLVAAIPAALSVVKSMVAAFVGDKGTASLVPLGD